MEWESLSGKKSFIVGVLRLRKQQHIHEEISVRKIVECPWTEWEVSSTWRFPRTNMEVFEVPRNGPCSLCEGLGL